MKKQIILIVIGFFIVVVVSFYLPMAPVNVTELQTAQRRQWIKHWDELDLAAIKREYQPYTVAEMREMWNDKLLAKYGGHERLKQAIGEADNVYPQDTYLARMLELGRPFVDFSDYEDALTDQRIELFSTRVYWGNMTVQERVEYLERRGLSSDATWEMYEETLLKNAVVYSINFWRSKEQDPYMNGTLPSCYDKTSTF